MKLRFLFLFILLNTNPLFAFEEPKTSYIMVLGIAQDGGYPHMGCQKVCCNAAWKNIKLKRSITSIALVDPIQKKWWLFEATPDIKEQLQTFKKQTKGTYPYLPDGIFITHAHIGHYSGLMEFGREVMGTSKLKVYTLPKLKSYLSTNGPWSQLIKLQNIELIELSANVPLTISDNAVTAFTVPHRDEFSETAGFKIVLPTNKFLFIPDIDKWNKWDKSIINEVKNVDVAFLDATFYTNTELGNRSIAEVPHPLVSETMNLFANETVNTKQKIYFIHFNHTNPLLWNHKVQNDLLKTGFRKAEELQVFN
ncbi:MAG: MBL fold metallo-hydrolase [Bacteroidota bacterium]